MTYPIDQVPQRELVIVGSKTTDVRSTKLNPDSRSKVSTASVNAPSSGTVSTMLYVTTSPIATPVFNDSGSFVVTKICCNVDGDDKVIVASSLETYNLPAPGTDNHCPDNTLVFAYAVSVATSNLAENCTVLDQVSEK